MLEGLIYDTRHALRGLRRSPGFTLTAAVALALGIGINASVFALFDALAFRPMVAEEPERLVAVYGQRRDESRLRFSYQDLLDYQEGTRGVLESLGGAVGYRGSLADGDGAAMVWMELVTPSWFETVRPRMKLGRMLGPSDEDGAVLSHELWKNRYGSDRGVVGRSVDVNGVPFTVVGVAAPLFFGTRFATFAPDVWLPALAIERVRPQSAGVLEGRARFLFVMTGRLLPGVTLDGAKSALDAVAAGLGAEFSESHGERTNHVVSNERPENVAGYGGVTDDQTRYVAFVALAGVGLLLLIACANVANLQLARGIAQRREVALRMSLGAGRARVVRQRLVESVLVALLGGVLSLASVALLTRVSDESLPMFEFNMSFGVALERRVTVYIFLISAAAGVLAALWPALRESRSDPADALKAATGGSVRAPWLLGGLVIAQVTFSVIVLIGAMLLWRSAEHQARLDPGFSFENGLVLTMDPALNRYTPDEVRDFYDRLLRELRALPGSGAVSRATTFPLSGTYPATTRVALESEAAPADAVEAIYQRAAPGWHRTLGVRLVEGRPFSATDTAGAPLVAVVNRTLARRLFGEASAVGRRVRIGTSRTADVVGVVEDTRTRSVRDAPDPVLTLSLDQLPASRTDVLMRTRVPPAGLMPAVRRVVAEIDPTVAYIGPRTLEIAVAPSFAATRTGAATAARVALLALLLTVAGMYGVVSYGVSRRRREIGIRMALGAARTDVAGMVVGRGIRYVAIGLGIGVLAAFALSGVAARLVYGVSPTDPVTYASVSAVLLAVGALASWLPARGASSVDPVQVLRSD